MEKQYTVAQIGVVRSGEDGFRVELRPEYRPAMAGLEGFGYVQLLWWFHRCDTPQARSVRTERRPYVHGPDVLGTFATRSPERPNPLALSCACVTGLDREAGVIELAYLDAEDGSPVLDVKPYVPSLDRVEAPGTPGWCAHWPASVEDSGGFDWSAEFNF